MIDSTRLTTGLEWNESEWMIDSMRLRCLELINTIIKWMFRFEIPSRDGDFVQFLESFDFTIKICEYDFFFFNEKYIVKKVCFIFRIFEFGN